MNLQAVQRCGCWGYTPWDLKKISLLERVQVAPGTLIGCLALDAAEASAGPAFVSALQPAQRLCLTMQPNPICFLFILYSADKRVNHSQEGGEIIL